MKRPVSHLEHSGGDPAAIGQDEDATAGNAGGGSGMADEIARRCLRLMLDDGAWNDLGFAGRPRLGTLWQRFRPQWRRSLDLALKREILTGLTAAHAAASILDADALAEVISLYAADPLLFEPLGYASRSAALADLHEAVAAYLAIPETQWPALLYIRLHIATLPDRQLAARLEKGVERFGKRLIARVRHLRQA